MATRLNAINSSNCSFLFLIKQLISKGMLTTVQLAIWRFIELRGSVGRNERLEFFFPLVLPCQAS